MVDGRLEKVELESEFVEAGTADIFADKIRSDETTNDVEISNMSLHDKLRTIDDSQDEFSVCHHRVAYVHVGQLRLKVFETDELGTILLARETPRVVKVRAKKADDSGGGHDDNVR